MKNKVALALGGNIGNVKKNFSEAIAKLEANGVEDIKYSSNYTTTPVECRLGAPDFVNAALTGYWSGSPDELFQLCKKLEAEAGRPKNYERNSDRPLDVDIILFGEQLVTEAHLVIPHKEMHNRLFVLIPLCEVAPEMVHPSLNKTVLELLKEIDNDEEYKKIMRGKGK